MREGRYKEPRRTLKRASEKRSIKVPTRPSKVNLELRLRRQVAYFLLFLFALNTVSALAIIFLVGFGLMTLSSTVIISFIGETIAYTAAMFFTVTKHLFPSK
jgi:hypothetical protein